MTRTWVERDHPRGWHGRWVDRVSGAMPTGTDTTVDDTSVTRLASWRADSLRGKTRGSGPFADYGDRLHIEDDTQATHDALAALAAVPAPIHRHLSQYLARSEKGGIWVGARPVPQLDHAQDLAGVRPRGWSEGKSWDDVDGAYRSRDRALMIGYTGNSGGGKRTPEVAAHEFGHGLDYSLGRLSQKPTWVRLHKQAVVAGQLSPYFRQAGAGGRSELWATAFATWSSGRQAGDPAGAIATRFGITDRAVSAEIATYFDTILATLDR